MIDELHITVDDLCVGDLIRWRDGEAFVVSVGPIDDDETRRWYRVQPRGSSLLFTEYDDHAWPITKLLLT